MSGYTQAKFNVGDNSVYLSGRNDIGVILIHGRDKHPTFKVANPLRISINQKLKYHILSIQMVTFKGQAWKTHGKHFGNAESRIKSSIAYLRLRGIKRIFLVGSGRECQHITHHDTLILRVWLLLDAGHGFRLL
jgi:hypothetical protein